MGALGGMAPTVFESVDGTGQQSFFGRFGHVTSCPYHFPYFGYVVPI